MGLNSVNLEKGIFRFFTLKLRVVLYVYYLIYHLIKIYRVALRYKLNIWKSINCFFFIFMRVNILFFNILLVYTK